ncbi:hypothetical protein P7C73_g4515, partial [Tremellales sp. Uapishka_1]
MSFDHFKPIPITHITASDEAKFNIFGLPDMQSHSTASAPRRSQSADSSRDQLRWLGASPAHRPPKLVNPSPLRYPAKVIVPHASISHLSSSTDVLYHHRPSASSSDREYRPEIKTVKKETQQVGRPRILELGCKREQDHADEPEVDKHVSPAPLVIETGRISSDQTQTHHGSPVVVCRLTQSPAQDSPSSDVILNPSFDESLLPASRIDDDVDRPVSGASDRDEVFDLKSGPTASLMEIMGRAGNAVKHGRKNSR